MPTVVIADDHLVLREGVKSVLRAIEDLEVVAEATNGLELASLVEKHCPDLVIVDLSMPTLGGIEAIVRIQKLPHKPCILVLSARGRSRLMGVEQVHEGMCQRPRQAMNDFAIRRY